MSTIKDIANRAGVSTATVSYVINGTRFVSPELRERVMSAVVELDYRPNAVAQSLRQKRTRTIGLIVPDNSNPFFAEVAKGVEDAGYDAGVSVMLCNSDGSFDRELRYLQAAAGQAGGGHHLHRHDSASRSPGRHRRAIDPGRRLLPSRAAVRRRYARRRQLRRRLPRHAPSDRARPHPDRLRRPGLGRLPQLAPRQRIPSGDGGCGAADRREPDLSRRQPVRRRPGRRRTSSGHRQPLHRPLRRQRRDGARRDAHLPAARARGARRRLGRRFRRDRPRRFRHAVADDRLQPRYEAGHTAFRLLLERIEEEYAGPPRAIELETTLVVRESSAPPRRDGVASPERRPQ